MIGKVAHEIVQQKWNFLPALPHGRHANRVCAEAVVKVLTKFVFGDCRFNVGRAGYQNPNINGNYRPTSWPGELLGLQNLQQLGLQCHRHFSNFIQKNRATELEFAWFRLREPGSVSFASEQFGFQQIAGESCAIDSREPESGPDG